MIVAAIKKVSISGNPTCLLVNFNLRHHCPESLDDRIIRSFYHSHIAYAPHDIIELIRSTTVRLRMEDSGAKVLGELAIGVDLFSNDKACDLLTGTFLLNPCLLLIDPEAR